MLSGFLAFLSLGNGMAPPLSLHAPGVAPSSAQLDRHQQLRWVVTSSVSVLVGAVGVASRVWRKWSEVTNRSAVTIAQPDAASLCMAGMRETVEKHDL